MRTEAVLWALVAIGAYVLWRSTRPSETEPKPPDSEMEKVGDVPVEVVETKKLSANASVTQPSFAQPIFRKDWITRQVSVHDSNVTYSGFN